MDPQKPRQYDYSFALTATSSGAFGIGSNLSWDAYQREIYNQLNTALQKQAELLLKRGNPSAAEISALVDQRNLILAETRSNLSPFGELYSELLKPSNDLPTLEKLLAQKRKPRSGPGKRRQDAGRCEPP